MGESEERDELTLAGGVAAVVHPDCDRPGRRRITVKQLTGMAMAGLVAGMLAGCGGNAPAPAPTAETPAGAVAPAHAAKYVCPMHKDEMSDKPGKCPKCGMDMVPKA